MLRAAVSIMDSTPPEEYSDESLLAMLALEILALHIKNAAHEDEREVRLVFSAQRNHPIGQVRVSGSRLATYVEARPLTDEESDLVRAVKLGPLAGGRRSAEALRLHHRNFTREALNSFDAESRGLKVTLSKTRYSE